MNSSRACTTNGHINAVDRIVSISQPHVRPIVRGRQGKDVEFGARLGLSLMDGFMTRDNLSRDAYNESGDLPRQAEAYKALSGHYPELIQADKIDATHANRTLVQAKVHQAYGHTKRQAS